MVNFPCIFVSQVYRGRGTQTHSDTMNESSRSAPRAGLSGRGGSGVGWPMVFGRDHTVRCVVYILLGPEQAGIM